MDKKEPEVVIVARPQPGRRRRYSANEKLQLLNEAELPGESVSSVARRYGIAANLMFKWRRLRDEGALTGVNSCERLVPESETTELKAQVRELERLLGQKTLENEVLKEAVRIAKEKKLLSRAALQRLERLR